MKTSKKRLLGVILFTLTSCQYQELTAFPFLVTSFGTGFMGGTLIGSGTLPNILSGTALLVCYNTLINYLKKPPFSVTTKAPSVLLFALPSFITKSILTLDETHSSIARRLILILVLTPLFATLGAFFILQKRIKELQTELTHAITDKILSSELTKKETLQPPAR